MMARSQKFRAYVTPIVGGTYSLPKSALIPLFILWFGIGTTTAVCAVYLACLLPMIVHTYHGVAATPKVLVWSAQALGATRRRARVADLSAPRLAGHFDRPADRARIFVRAGDLVGDDRLDQRHRQADLHVRRERRLRLHVRRDSLHRHRRVRCRPADAAGHCHVPAVARVRRSSAKPPEEGTRRCAANSPKSLALRLRSIGSVAACLSSGNWPRGLELAPPLFLPSFTSCSSSSRVALGDGTLLMDLGAELVSRRHGPGTRDCRRRARRHRRWHGAASCTGCSIR